MGFLGIFINDTKAVDSGKAPDLCRDLVPGSRGASACARARRAREVGVDLEISACSIAVCILKYVNNICAVLGLNRVLKGAEFSIAWMSRFQMRFYVRCDVRYQILTYSIETLKILEIRDTT
jgi:hypothetical protein